MVIYGLYIHSVNAKVETSFLKIVELSNGKAEMIEEATSVIVPFP